MNIEYDEALMLCLESGWDDFENIPVKPVGDSQSTSETLLLRTESGEISTGYVREFLTIKVRSLIMDSDEIDENVDIDPIAEFAFCE